MLKENAAGVGIRQDNAVQVVEITLLFLELKIIQVIGGSVQGHFVLAGVDQIQIPVHAQIHQPDEDVLGTFFPIAVEVCRQAHFLLVDEQLVVAGAGIKAVLYLQFGDGLIFAAYRSIAVSGTNHDPGAGLLVRLDGDVKAFGCVGDSGSHIPQGKQKIVAIGTLIGLHGYRVSAVHGQGQVVPVQLGGLGPGKGTGNQRKHQ